MADLYKSFFMSIS